MGRIVMSGPQNVSLDGVAQDPDGKEGFSLGGWFVEHGGKDLKPWMVLARADALAWLLGRRSYEYFGERWRPRHGELADRLTAVPKYVVSSTLTDPELNNTAGIEGDAVTRVSQLKLPDDAGWRPSPNVDRARLDSCSQRPTNPHRAGAAQTPVPSFPQLSRIGERSSTPNECVR